MGKLKINNSTNLKNNNIFVTTQIENFEAI